MQIQFIRNIQFTKLLKANGRLREFNFRKANALKEGLITVDVCDDRGNRIIFSMQKEAENWKIMEQQLPVWILDKEPNLNELISEEMRNVYHS
jgi:hypothetical protein